MKGWAKVQCVHSTCRKMSGYTITSSAHTAEVCGAHIKWAIDQLLYDGETFTVKKHKPVTPQRDTVYLSVAIKVDREAWETEYGANPKGLSDDVKSYVLTEITGSAGGDWFESVDLS